MNPPPSYPTHFLTPQQSPLMMNNTSLDGSGTINPATLNPAVLSNTSPRGVKRSRSPDTYQAPANDAPSADPVEGEPPARRKRGRPPKNKSAVPATPTSTSQQVQSSPQLSQHQLQQSPHLPHHSPPQSIEQQIQTTPIQAHAIPHTAPDSTPVKTPAKPVVKALPTVRDHTTDQLTPEGDEYIPRETDDEGEKKVTPTGHLTAGREYKCRTFLVPGRGEKLFMLATECARVLGYRDSYLLFNKNRSLYKIIATQAEKEDLIAKELLPYSYRSRQIAIVTAKSMFRQFGSRVIVNGRRVRDDYFVAKARKQGFTEDDPAGEKRPGAGKQRSAQLAEQAAAQAAAQQQHHHHEPLYGHDSVHLDTQPQPQMVQPGVGSAILPGVNLAPLPMIHLTPNEDSRLRDIYPVQRPRQEITGAPYFDRTSTTPQSQLLEQSQHAAQYNKDLTAQRTLRKGMYNDFWKPKSPPVLAQHSPISQYTQQQQPPQQQQQTRQAQQPSQAGAPSQPGQPQSLRNPQPQTQQHRPSITQAQVPQSGQHQQSQQPSPQTQPQSQVPQQMPTPPTTMHAQHTTTLPPHQQLGQPAMMSPQQMSNLHHQQSQQQHHNMPVAQPPMRLNQGIKPDQLHQQHANYLPQQQPMWPQHAQQAHHQQMSPPQTHHQVHHPQQMQQMHHPSQSPHYASQMYSPQHFLQQQQQQQQSQQQSPAQQWKQLHQQQHHAQQWGYPGTS